MTFGNDLILDIFLSAMKQLMMQHVQHVGKQENIIARVLTLIQSWSLLVVNLFSIFSPTFTGTSQILMVEHNWKTGICRYFALCSWELFDFLCQEITEKLQHSYNVGGFFIWNVGEDDKNSSRHVIQLDQGGLTLTTRDQYLNKTVDDDPVLSSLLAVMTTTSLMLYRDKKNLSSIHDISSIIQKDIEKQMREIIEFEIELASITIPAAQQREGETR